jgi:hypothetical protein
MNRPSCRNQRRSGSGGVRPRFQNRPELPIRGTSWNPHFQASVAIPDPETGLPLAIRHRVMRGKRPAALEFVLSRHYTMNHRRFRIDSHDRCR